MGKKSKKGQHHDAEHAHHKTGEGTHHHHKHHGGPLYNKYHKHHSSMSSNSDNNDDNNQNQDAATTTTTTTLQQQQDNPPPPTAQDDNIMTLTTEELPSTARELDWQMVSSPSNERDSSIKNSNRETNDDKETEPLKEQVATAVEQTKEADKVVDEDKPSMTSRGLVVEEETTAKDLRGIDNNNKSTRRTIQTIVQRSLYATLTTGLPLWLLLVASSARILDKTASSYADEANYALHDSLWRGTLVEDVFGFTSIVPWEFYCSWWFRSTRGSSSSNSNNGLVANRQGLSLGAWLAQ